MKKLWFIGIISLYVLGCEHKPEKVPQPNAPIIEVGTIVQDTPPPLEADPDYQEDYYDPPQVHDSMRIRGYTASQVDSIRRLGGNPVRHEPGKGYDGRLPKDSAERARMIRIRELQRVRDSLWREQEYGKKGK
jgi:hypothetical protein